jgi:predicted dienelactone hydrolase
MTSDRITLPTPTGPYQVGRVAYHWVDAHRDDIYAENKGQRRELVVWVWYPAAPTLDAQPGAYLPGSWATIGQAFGFDADQVRIHAFPDAPVSPGQPQHPVLLFSPMGFPPHLFTATIEELASHGYIVVGVNHTYETMPVTVFPDGRVVPFNPAATGGAHLPPTGLYEEDVRKRAAVINYKVADLQFVVSQLEHLDTKADPLARQLDLERWGVFGFSMGGAAVTEFCRIDRRCKAGANLDGGLWSEVCKAGPQQPFLLVTAEHAEFTQPWDDTMHKGLYPSVEYCKAFVAGVVEGWQALYTSAQPGYSILVKGAEHISFMDFPPLPLQPQSPMQGQIASIHIDSRRMWRVINDYLLAFFGKHLSNIHTPILDNPSPAYPEVVFGAPEVLFKKER